MGVMLDTIGQLIAGYLQKEVPGYEPFTPSDPEHLRGVIEPGDELLSRATTASPASSNTSRNPPGRTARSMSARSTALANPTASRMSSSRPISAKA